MSDSSGAGWTPSEPTGPGDGDPRWNAQAPAPKPGIIPLRPLSFGEILEGAFGLLRRHPGTVLGLAAVLAMVQAILTTATIVIATGSLGRAATALNWQPEGFAAGEEVTPAQLRELLSELGPVATALGLAGIIGFLISLLGAGLFTVLTARAVLGKDINAQRAWSEVLPRLLPLVGATLLFALIIGSFALVATLVITVAALAGDVGAGIAALLAVTALVAVIWMIFRLVLANTVVVLEKASPVTALRRSWRLTRGSWGRVFSIIVITSLMASIAGNLIAIPIVQLGTLSGVTSTGPTDGAVVAGNMLATFVQALVSLPFVSAAISLLYMDQRMRKENLAEVLITASQTPDE
jgi:hypothetical protein